jgi:hypothetical protein
MVSSQAVGGEDGGIDRGVGDVERFVAVHTGLHSEHAVSIIRLFAVDGD